MTATQSTLARPALRGRTTSMALVVVFAVGLLTGLVVPRLQLPTLASGAGTTAAEQNWQAYRDYRSGEQILPTVSFSQAEIEKAWMDFRAGERDASGSR